MPALFISGSSQFFLLVITTSLSFARFAHLRSRIVVRGSREVDGCVHQPHPPPKRPRVGMTAVASVSQWIYMGPKRRSDPYTLLAHLFYVPSLGAQVVHRGRPHLESLAAGQNHLHPPPSGGPPPRRAIFLLGCRPLRVDSRRCGRPQWVPSPLTTVTCRQPVGA